MRTSFCDRKLYCILGGLGQRECFNIIGNLLLGFHLCRQLIAFHSQPSQRLHGRHQRRQRSTGSLRLVSEQLQRGFCADGLRASIGTLHDELVDDHPSGLFVQLGIVPVRHTLDAIFSALVHVLFRHPLPLIGDERRTGRANVGLLKHDLFARTESTGCGLSTHFCFAVNG
jgi:hypothetical protein